MELMQDVLADWKASPENLGSYAPRPSKYQIAREVVREYRQTYKDEFGYAVSGDIDHALLRVEHWLEQMGNTE